MLRTPSSLSYLLEQINIYIHQTTHSRKDCKVVKRKPLYKKGAETDPKNFRPISLLPSLENHRGSKTRLNYELPNGKQHSLQLPIWISQEPFSTDTSRSYMPDKILTGFDSGLKTGMILIDWFEYYLSRISFRGNIQNKYSSITKFDCGAPQGSILGPSNEL